MNDNMKEDVLRVLLSEDEIREKVRELGGKITADYKNSNLMLVTVLKGAVVFLADLMRQIDVPAEIDFMVVSSYGSGVKSSGVVKIVKDLDVPLAGKDILIVEDILDSGLTLSYIKELLESRGPRSIRIATLLDKPSRRKVDLQLDAELLGQRVLDGEAVIPIGDLAQTANEARLVQRHDLLALGDAGGRKAIAAQADVRRQSCCLAVARQRYGRDDGAEVVCHVVGHDNDGTGAVLDMAGCDR